MITQNGLEAEDLRILEILKNKNSIILLNKIDEKDNGLKNDIRIKNVNKPVVKISAKTKEGLEDLYEQILKMFKLNEIEINGGEVITNIRHKNQIRKSIDNLEQAKKETKNQKETDLQNLIYKQLNSCILSNDYDKINMLIETLKTIR